MKTKSRLSILLPVKGAKQRRAADLVLRDLKDKFGENGGSWYGTESFDPVVAGWWDNPAVRSKRRAAIESGMAESEAWIEFPLDEDTHVLVSIDVDASPDSESLSCSEILSCFARRYRGRHVAQRAVYICRQSVVVHELPGRISKTDTGHQAPG